MDWMRLEDLWHWNPMTSDEINQYRMTAYLSFEEEDEVKAQTPPYEMAQYRNAKGNLIPCRVLLRRANGEIVVQRENGCRICLTQDKLVQ